MVKDQTTHNDKKFLIRFVTSYSVVMVFFLLLGFFSYYNIVNNMEQDIKKESITLLEKDVIDFETNISMFSTLTAQIANSSAIKKLLYMKDLNSKYYLQAAEAMDYLTEIMSLKDALPTSKYYIFLPYTDYLISSTSLTDMKRFYTFSKHYDDPLLEDWYALVSSRDNLEQFIPLNRFKANNNVYLYKLQVSNTIISSPEPAIVCFEISESDLKTTFSHLFINEDSHLYVTNEDNDEIFTLHSTGSNTLPIVPSVFIREFSKESKTQALAIEMEDYVITKVNSGGRNYYLLQQSSRLLSHLKIYRNMYLLLMTLFFLFILGTIYLISKRNVKPIIEMNNELESSLIQNETLQTELTRQRPFVYNSCIAQVMKGRISSEDALPAIVDYLHIADYQAKKFMVLYTVIYPAEEDFLKEDVLVSRSGEEDVTQVTSLFNEDMEFVTTSIYDYLGENLCIYHPDISVYAILAYTDESEDTNEFAESLVSKFSCLHEHLQNEYGIWIVGGLGKKNSKLNYVWESYQEAMDTITYLKKGEFFNAYCNIEKQNNNYYYTYELANQLTNFIKSGNSKQVSELFRIIRKENFELRTLPMQIIKWLLSDLRNTLVKIRYNIEETPQNTYVLTQVDRGMTETKSIELMEQLALSLTGLFSKEADGNPLILSIQTYIQGNYKDPDLSLKKISEEFKISECYFSYLFKSETSQNFSDYLETLRMNKAMDLVRDTDLPLSDIYIETGYNNSNSFRRAFKKVYGNSPKAFREEATNSLSDSDD